MNNELPSDLALHNRRIQAACELKNLYVLGDSLGGVRFFIGADIDRFIERQQQHTYARILTGRFSIARGPKVDRLGYPATETNWRRP